MTYLDSAPSTDPGPDKPKEAGKPSGRLRKYWREIEAYGKAASDWHDQAETIVKLYLDQHRTKASPRRFALLWSNIETLKPSVYAKLPTVLCSRRYKDPHPVGRTAAELLERATNATFDLYRVDERFRMVRDDRLLTARGQAWVRYEADLETAEDNKGGQYDKVKSEKVCVDYVHWKDFGHNVAGTWGDVWLVWRRVYKTKEEIAKRFDTKANKVSEKLNYSAKTAADDDKEMGEHKACLFELWDKQRNKVCFITKDCPEILEDGKPPINFRDFFPCPEPCYGSKTSKSLFPTPDYRYYQDQAQEIDDLTEKIANLTDFLVMRGFVPAGPSADGADAIRTMIQSLQSAMTSNKNVFIPVESWAGFTEKGGAAKLIDWLPVEKVMQALQAAVETRNQLVQDVYQITGISDILRGQTDPDETLGAQQLKSQTGARRVANAKDEIARFCRDIGQLVAEVIAEQFQPQTLADMTGYAYEPMVAPADPAQQMPQQSMPQSGMNGQAMPQMAAPPLAPAQPQSPSKQTFNDEVMALLRNDRMRGFLIDIETDSTIQPDEDAEKQRRTEFVTGVGTFIKEAGAVLPSAPALAPMFKEMLLFVVRGYRAGRSLEEVIERSMDALGQQLQQPQPDPEQQKLEMQMQAEQAKMQMQMQMDQQKLALEKEKLSLQHQVEMAKLQMEQQRQVQELEMERAKLELARVEGEQKIQLEMQKAQMDAELERMKTEHEMQLADMKQRHDAELSEREAAVKEDLARQAAEMDKAKFNQDNAMAAQEFHGKQKRENEAHQQKIKLTEAEARARMESDAKGSKERVERKKQITGKLDGKDFNLTIR